MIRTILRNNSPTLSSPTPPGKTFPSASSSCSENMSENRASSVILEKMVLVSSKLIGGPPDEVDPVEESEAVETVRADDPEEFEFEFGGVAGENGMLCPGWEVLESTKKEVREAQGRDYKCFLPGNCGMDWLYASPFNRVIAPTQLRSLLIKGIWTCLGANHAPERVPA